MAKKILLLAVIILAFLLRVYRLTSVPPALNWDEVSIGYNAHSIIETGRDEFGRSWPLYFRSLDDYKLPVDVYLTVLSEKAFGYTDFAVRFPSVIFGTIAVAALYFLARQLLLSQKIALLATLILAVLPWHIQFSRMAMEAGVALSLTVLMVLSFLLGVKKSSWWFLAAVVFLVLTMYTYLSFRVIAPLLLGILVLFFYRQVKLRSRPVLLALVYLGLFAGVAGKDLLASSLHYRFSGTSVLNDAETYKEQETEMFYDATLKINLTRKFLHENKILTSAGLIVRGYLTHFSPDFLFFDYGRHHHAPNSGLLYLWMLPAVFLGIYSLAKRSSKYSWFIFLWLLASPIPASVTWDIPHAIRDIGFVVPASILAAMGVVFVKGKLKLLVVPIFALFCFYYFHQYFIHFPAERSQNWQYGRKELAEFIKTDATKYQKVIVSTRLEWPNVFILYYSRYDSGKYLQQGGTTSNGWAAEDNRLDNLEFHKFSYSQNSQHNILYVGRPDEFPDGVKPLKIIYNLDKSPAIYLVKS